MAQFNISLFSSKWPMPRLHPLHSSPLTTPDVRQWSIHRGLSSFPQMAHTPPCLFIISSYCCSVIPYWFLRWYNLVLLFHSLVPEFNLFLSLFCWEQQVLHIGYRVVLVLFHIVKNSVDGFIERQVLHSLLPLVICSCLWSPIYG